MDIRGWSETLAHVIKDTFKLQTASYGGLSGMPMSAKMEMESDMSKQIALLVIHSVRFKNCPFTIDYDKDIKKLHEKKELDKSPPGLEFQQLDLVLMRDVNKHAAAQTRWAKNEDGEEYEVDIARRDILVSISKDSEKRECEGSVDQEANGTAVLHRKSTRGRASKQSRADEPQLLGDSMDTLLDFALKTCPAEANVARGLESIDNKAAHAKFLNEQMPAFVAWTLFDSVIDGIDFTRTQIMDWMDMLDDEVTRSPQTKHMQHLHDMEEVISTMVSVSAAP